MLLVINVHSHFNNITKFSKLSENSKFLLLAFSAFYAKIIEEKIVLTKPNVNICSKMLEWSCFYVSFRNETSKYFWTKSCFEISWIVENTVFYVNFFSLSPFSRCLRWHFSITCIGFHIRPSASSSFYCHNSMGLYLITRLRLGLSHHRFHKF